MSRWFGRRLGGITAPAACLLAVAALAAVSWAPQLSAQAQEPEEAPPAGQEYVGSKKCASCHFEQFMSWKKTLHSKAFELLPAEYQKDEKCLKCHTTGYGEPSGFKDPASTAGLVGVTCEVCHGPGSKHAEAAEPLAQVKTLSPEQEKLVRGTIWLLQPHAVCIGCHVMQAHQENPTPPELRVRTK